MGWGAGSGKLKALRMGSLCLSNLQLCRRRMQIKADRVDSERERARGVMRGVERRRGSEVAA